MLGLAQYAQTMTRSCLIARHFAPLSPYSERIKRLDRHLNKENHPHPAVIDITNLLFCCNQIPSSCFHSKLSFFVLEIRLEPRAGSVEGWSRGQAQHGSGVFKPTIAGELCNSKRRQLRIYWISLSCITLSGPQCRESHQAAFRIPLFDTGHLKLAQQL